MQTYLQLLKGYICRWKFRVEFWYPSTIRVISSEMPKNPETYMHVAFEDNEFLWHKEAIIHAVPTDLRSVAVPSRPTKKIGKISRDFVQTQWERKFINVLKFAESPDRWRLDIAVLISCLCIGIMKLYNISFVQLCRYSAKFIKSMMSVYLSYVFKYSFFSTKLKYASDFGRNVWQLRQKQLHDIRCGWEGVPTLTMTTHKWLFQRRFLNFGFKIY